MIIHKCDRCEAEVQPEEAARLTIAGERFGDDAIDLCRKCHDAFRMWLLLSMPEAEAEAGGPLERATQAEVEPKPKAKTKIMKTEKTG